MTLAAKWRRSTAAERRANRAAFAALKRSAPLPPRLKFRSSGRRSAQTTFAATPCAR
jgi:hypothetical protein